MWRARTETAAHARQLRALGVALKVVRQQCHIYNGFEPRGRWTAGRSSWTRQGLVEDAGVRVDHHVDGALVAVVDQGLQRF